MTWTPQFLTLEKVAPRPSSPSPTRKRTTLVRPTSASSPSVNPVSFLPSTSGFPAAVFTWRRTPGAWQTSATGFPAARKDSISLMELGSSATRDDYRACVARRPDHSCLWLACASRRDLGQGTEAGQLADMRANSEACSRIPYSTEQGIFAKEQGRR